MFTQIQVVEAFQTIRDRIKTSSIEMDERTGHDIESLVNALVDFMNDLPIESKCTARLAEDLYNDLISKEPTKI